MNVTHSPATLVSTLEQLKEKALQHLASKNESILSEKEMREINEQILERLLPLLKKGSHTTASLKGLCTRIKSSNDVIMSYGAYLSTVAIVLGYGSWQSLMTNVNRDDSVENRYFKKFEVNVSMAFEETNVPVTKGLAKLAKGSHVTWANLQSLLKKLSSPDLYPVIDALLMEMQMAVGITAATDPRGDMLFAVFRENDNDTDYTILGEKYRPPFEREGAYPTVMVHVRTYPLSSRIESISLPKGHCYSPRTIRDRVTEQRANKHRME